MNRINAICLVLALCLPAGILRADEIDIGSPPAIGSWTKTVESVRAENGVLVIERADTPLKDGHIGIYRNFHFDNLKGRNAVLSVEVSGENLVAYPGRRGKVNVQAIYKNQAGKYLYFECPLPLGTFDWRKAEVAFPVPPDGSFNLCLGLQNASGIVRFRNLGISEADSFLDFHSTANMGFADEKGADGKGGWTDQGPDNDASGFDRTKSLYAGIPFKIGTRILVFHSSHFRNGLDKVTIPVNASGKYFYLLHTAGWCSPDSGVVGKIQIEGENGSQELAVESGRELGDQWNPVAKPNGFVAEKWSNGRGGSNGVYASRFKLDPKIGKIRNIVLEAKNPDAVWLVVSVLVSNMNYEFPAVKDYTVRENEIWKPLKRPESLLIAKDSALDFSFLNQNRRNERIIIRDGHFAFADAPGKPLRLYGFQVNTFTHDYYTSLRGEKQFHSKGPWRDKKSIEQEVLQLTRAGANMVRVHLFNCLYVEDGEVVWYEDKFDALAYDGSDSTVEDAMQAFIKRIADEEGAYSQLACDKFIKLADIVYVKSFEGVFQAVEQGLCDYGVLPIENSLYGTVGAVYDLMRNYKFHIVRSLKMHVSHALLVKPGTKLSDVREIISHDQALGQCSRFIKSLKDVKVTICENTAIAAKMVSESGNGHVAAISSHRCAELYGLESIAESIQNNDHNYTRFICISRKLEIYPGSNRVSLIVSAPHRPGALYNMMAKFASLGLNLTKLESRPIPGRDFEFLFYFDLEATVRSKEVVELLNDLASGPDLFVFLGCYTEV